MSLNQDQRAYRATEQYKINYREWSKRWRRLNPEKTLYRSCKKRASREGLDFNIDFEDITIPSVCPILNEELVSFGEDRRYWPSVDRVDNTLGYVKGNVRVISYKANMMKSDLLIWQVENLLDYMKGS